MKALSKLCMLGRVTLAVALCVVAAIAEEIQEEGASEALPEAESAAEAVGLLCPADIPCKLEIGTAFGIPWLNAEDGELGYFEVSATPQLQPSEIIVTLAVGDVVTYAKRGGQEPTRTDYDWKGGRVLHLPGWSVPHEGETLVVMVEATTLSAKYRVLAASNEDILRLEDGMPVQMTQVESEMRYFSIAIQDNATDLLLSLDAQYGDPDMYVSLEDPEGRFLPSKQNFTWQAISFGTDTLHMQSENLSEYCAPGTDATEVCTYNIGVLAKTNCSYTLKASLNSGWKHPQQLLLGHPQSSFLVEGTYDYYALLVPPQRQDEPRESIVLTLTPKTGGQQDVFITTNSSREPGPTDYDVKSNTWGGSSAVVFSETAPGFCTDCTMYVGVYGFTSGSYSIVASQGLTRLQEGFPQQGSVGLGSQQQYYEFFNPPGNLQPIQVVVTRLTGDPDIYVSVEGGDLPGPHNFNWMGGATGTDFIDMSPTDDLFCNDCVYTMGVTSSSNSSFTLSVTHVDERAPTSPPTTTTAPTVTLLAHGRPQAGRVGNHGLLHYIVQPDSDTHRLTVSMTKSYGLADLYMTRLDGDNITAIDPMDDSTFSWTSKGLAEDKIIVEGEGPLTGTRPYLIAAGGGSMARFVVTATFSEGVSLLQAGVPQRHALQAGKSMSFGFLVDEDDEDLQLTLTPIRGDVALYANMGVRPSCDEPQKGGDMGEVVIAGDEEGEVVCSGWTWSSTSGFRRDITISSGDPCDVSGQQPRQDDQGGEGDGDGDADGDANAEDVAPIDESAQVDVSEECRPSSFGVGMMFMTVAVQGTSGAYFSIMASLVGKHVALIAGVPQHAVTSPMIPCGSPIAAENGPCSAQSEASSVMQEALFVLRVMPGSGWTTSGFSLSLLPDCPPGSCNAGANSTCPIGCPPKPAKAYVKSCLEGSCLPGDRFPSEGNADKEFDVSPAHGSIFIDDKMGSPGDGVFCVPVSPKGGAKETACVYYIAVTAGGEDEPPMRLTATADVPHGATLVAPCIGDESLPDGMIVTGANHLPASGMKLFEICSKGDVDFQASQHVSVENCRGEVDLLICDDRCPQVYPSMEDSEYSYMSNGHMVCTIPAGKKVPQCEPLWQDGAQTEVSVTVEGAAAEGSTFFVGVGMRKGQRAQDQEHVLKINLLGEGGVPISPVLSANPLPAAADGAASRAFVQGSEATIEWGGATLQTPKISGEHPHDVEHRDCGDYCTFEVFAVPRRLRAKFPHTPCGLKSVRDRFRVDVVYSYVGLAKASQAVTQMTLHGLNDEQHDIFVVATCDFLCLEALLRMQCSRTMGMIKIPCKSQVAVFPAAKLVSSMSALSGSSSSGGGGGGGGGRSSSGSHGGGSDTLRSPVLLMAAVLAAVGGILFALNRMGGGNDGGGRYTPADTSGSAESAGGGAWGWLVGGSGGGGGGSERQASAGAGFELTDLQRRGGGSQGGGGGVALSSHGLGDFLVGDRGRTADAAEAGPGYTSLLAGQEQ
ncbi:unnamed protein product [Scytosiphon promiscuus]